MSFSSQLFPQSAQAADSLPTQVMICMPSECNNKSTSFETLTRMSRNQTQNLSDKCVSRDAIVFTSLQVFIGLASGHANIDGWPRFVCSLISFCSTSRRIKHFFSPSKNNLVSYKAPRGTAQVALATIISLWLFRRTTRSFD